MCAADPGVLQLARVAGAAAPRGGPLAAAAHLQGVGLLPAWETARPAGSKCLLMPRERRHADDMHIVSDGCYVALDIRAANDVQVTVLVSTNCSSAGEALRLIDQKHLIKNDFVLVRVTC
jgi:hypothetical protein